MNKVITITPRLMHAETLEIELAEAKTRIAELERQAAIGRRAVEMLRSIQTVQTEVPGWSECPSCFCGSGHRSKERHKPNCELAAILRDADQAGVGL